MRIKYIAYLFIIPLTAFYMHFMGKYMWYFDVGINSGVRAMDIYWIRTPVAIIAQVIAVFIGNRYIGSNRWRLVLHFAILFGVLYLVFAGFAISDVGAGIPRQGGFLRFLGYYFFGLEPGHMPDGSW